MERIARGFRLTGSAWRMLKADAELMVLPLISGVLTIAVAATFFYGLAGGDVPAEETQLRAGHYIALGLFYLVANFITIYFNAAVVAAAMIRLDGGDPTVGDGLRAARDRVGKIFGWALLTATVGLLLRMLEERLGFVGRLIISIVGAAWSAVTFFVVPVLLFEEEGVGGSVKRSATLFKQRWGEQFTGTVSITLAVVLLSLPVFLVGTLMMTASVALGVLFFVLGIALVTALGGAMSGIFNAVLYRYATVGVVAPEFHLTDLKDSFAERKRRFL